MIHSRRKAPRRGAAAAEFGVVFALLILPLLLGVWEVSRLVEAKQLLMNACREAGRQASTGTKSENEVKQVLIDYLELNGVDTNGLQIQLTNKTSSSRQDPRIAEQLDQFEIYASLPYANIKGNASIIQLLNEVQVTATANWFSMRDIPVQVDPQIPVE